MTGQQLIDKWAAWIRTWVVLTPEQALTCALWSMHTWIYRHFGVTPYLSIVAQKGMGKTTLLETLELLTINPERCATVMVKTMVRQIAAAEGNITFLLDEAEKLGAPRLGDTRTMLATGYRKGAYHSISVGKSFERFPTFAPKCFASIGDLQDVLRDRSIVIDLERGQPAQSLTLHWAAASAQANDLVREYKAVLAEVIGPDGTFKTVDPDWLVNPRNREIWTPLFSLAATLGLGKRETDLLIGFSVDNGNQKQLPPRIYHAVQEARTGADDRTLSIRALADLLRVYGDAETFLTTTVAVERMREIPTSPWRTWNGTGLTEEMLGALLSRYALRSEQRRVGKRADNVRVRGYARQAVAAVAAKELPKD